MTDKLLSCPFCGGDAVVVTRGGWHVATCNDAVCQGYANMAVNTSRSKATAAWNTRALQDSCAKEWIEKMQWARKAAKPKELGMHLADIARLRCEYAEQQLTKARQALQQAHDWMDSQYDSQSKGNHKTFDMLMLREQRDAIAEALK